jgi:hypothetical protein
VPDKIPTRGKQFLDGRARLKCTIIDSKVSGTKGQVFPDGGARAHRRPPVGVGRCPLKISDAERSDEVK